MRVMVVGWFWLKKIRLGILWVIYGEDNKRIEEVKERIVEKMRYYVFKSVENNKNWVSVFNDCISDDKKGFFDSVYKNDVSDFILYVCFLFFDIVLCFVDCMFIENLGL